MKYLTRTSYYIMLILPIIIITSLQGMETTTTQPTQGLTGWLYWRSWILPKPQLLWYALNNNLFECDNQDHRALINEALLECIIDNDDVPLKSLLTLLKTKYPEEKLIEDTTAIKIYSLLRERQGGKNLVFRNQLHCAQKEHLGEAYIILKKMHQTLDNLIKTFDIYDNDQKQSLATFNTQHTEYKTTKQKILTMNPNIANDTDFSDSDKDGKDVKEKIMPSDSRCAENYKILPKIRQELHLADEIVYKLCDWTDPLYL